MASRSVVDIENIEHETSAEAKKVISVDVSGNITDASDIRFDPNDSVPDYIGTNKTQGAPTSNTDWLIYKLTYSGLNVTRIQKAVGSWDGRVGLF